MEWQNKRLVENLPATIYLLSGKDWQVYKWLIS